MEYVARFFTAHNIEAIGIYLALFCVVNSANSRILRPARWTNSQVLRRSR